MNSRLLQKHIDNVLLYLNPALQFTNCHMVEFFTGNLWEKYIPREIRDEMCCEEDVVAGIETFLGKETRKQYPNLQRLIRQSERYRLENLDGIILSEKEMFDCLNFQQSVDFGLNIKEFMNEKKNHEVEVVSNLMAILVSNLKLQNKDEFYIVDAGDGKGYLSSRMALQHGFKVLGIDSSEINTQGSQKRMEKLEKAWPGLKNRTEAISKGIVPPPRRRKKKRMKGTPDPGSVYAHTPYYKSTNCFITKDTDFAALIRENFTTKENFLMCLTGLHTCGNLATSCLEAFVNNSKMKALCNIGCCYHLIFEKCMINNDCDTCESDPINVENFGFPKSRFLKDKNVALGRNARMLASQSIHRTRTKEVLDTKSLFFRALLEVIVKEKYPSLKDTLRVGKLKKFSTFDEYLERCDQKCCLGISKLETTYIDEKFDEYKSEQHLLTLFYLIRMSYAQIIETLILLDRLLYIKENGIEKSYLVRLFDPVTSPRCYGIVAVR